MSSMQRDVLSEVMTSTVVTVEPTDPIRAAVRAMVEHGVGCCVVVEEDRPVGIFTERDLMRGLLEEPWILAVEVRAVMSAPLLTATPATSIDEAFETMTSWGIRRLPVVDRGRLVGIVTERDLLRWVTTIARLGG